MKLCLDRIALMICGTTVSSNPTIPGKTEVSPFSRSRATRLSLNSSLTRRVRKRSSEKLLRRRTPSVRGTLMERTPTQNYNDCDYTPAVTDSALSACFQHSMPTLGTTFLGGRFPRSLVLLVLSWLILASMSPTQSESALLPTPGQIREVACVSDRTQTYAVDVPSSATPGNRWT